MRKWIEWLVERLKGIFGHAKYVWEVKQLGDCQQLQCRTPILQEIQKSDFCTNLNFTRKSNRIPPTKFRVPIVKRTIWSKSIVFKNTKQFEIINLSAKTTKMTISCQFQSPMNNTWIIQRLFLPQGLIEMSVINCWNWLGAKLIQLWVHFDETDRIRVSNVEIRWKKMVSDSKYGLVRKYCHWFSLFSQDQHRQRKKNQQKLLPTCFNQVAAINGDFSHQETSTISNWKR